VGETLPDAEWIPPARRPLPPLPRISVMLIFRCIIIDVLCEVNRKEERQMSKRTISVLLTMVLAGIVAIPATAATVMPPPNPPAEMNVRPTHNRLAPHVRRRAWVLTVAGPGDLLIRRPFEAGYDSFSRSPHGGWRPAAGRQLHLELQGIPRAGGTAKAGEASAHSGGPFLRPRRELRGGGPRAPAQTLLSPLSTTLPPKTSLKAASWWSMDTLYRRGVQQLGRCRR